MPTSGAHSIGTTLVAREAACSTAWAIPYRSAVAWLLTIPLPRPARYAMRKPRATRCREAWIASRSVNPFERCAAIEAARAHPLPWSSLGYRNPRNSSKPPSWYRRSTSVPRKWPPFTRTARAPTSAIRRAAARASARDRTRRPASRSASYRFGVTRSAWGSRCRISASAKSPRSSRAPTVATITGSTTRGNFLSSSSSETVRTMSAEYNIPVFAPPMSKSDSTARSCARTSSTGSGKIELTVRVFWAVTHVITDHPWTPTAAKLLRSAWMPAPPPLSLPAIVRALFIHGPNWGARLKVGRSCGNVYLSSVHRPRHVAKGAEWTHRFRPVRDLEETRPRVSAVVPEVPRGERADAAGPRDIDRAPRGESSRSEGESEAGGIQPRGLDADDLPDLREG